MASQEKESKLCPVTLVNGSKGKISFYKSQYCSNQTDQNLTTFKTQIFRGVFENKMIVCVRRYEIASIVHDIKEISKGKDQITRDIEVLQEPQHLHENFIRYFCNENDADFRYVAIEWCICSVEDLYDGRDKNEKNWAGEKIDVDIIKHSLGKKELLRQATEGLAFLHALGFVHRNLKPSNFLIAQLRGFRYLVKLSDFRMSKDPLKCPIVSVTEGSNGWTNPKPATVGAEANTLTYFSGDVFILGCFFHYVLTDGKHPFGNSKHDRESNMTKSNYVVYGDGWEPNIDDKTAVTLLKDMIKFNLEEICTLDQVLDSRYFLPVNYYNLYGLPDVKPGLCVIFNQEIFDKEKNRVGSNFDEEYLKYVFSAFGFDVNIFQNLKAQDLRYQIEELAKQDFSFYASLVVCILSHGDEGVVAGVDSECIKINELKYKFNSNDCPTLNGKPKIWIIQACQGGDVQQPIKPNYAKVSVASSKSDSATDSSGNNVSHQKQQEFNELPVPMKRPKEIPTSSLTKEKALFQENLNKRPPLMDFFDIRASIPGYPAFRNSSGSSLVKYLCRVLYEECLSTNQQEPKSFEDILKQVQSHINPLVFHVKLKPADKELTEVKQTIEWRASLSDRIVFKKAKTTGIVKTISISKPDEDKNWLAKFTPEWINNLFS